METDHVIIGGGPAGIFAALTAADLGKRCVILEQNGQIGKKLRITGKGRCNVTNNCSQQDFLLHIPTNRSFLYSALSRCSPQDVMDFFEQQGVALKTERGNRVFPVSDRAEDIVTALQRALRARNIPVIRAKAKHLILKECLRVILPRRAWRRSVGSLPRRSRCMRTTPAPGWTKICSALCISIIPFGCLLRERCRAFRISLPKPFRTAIGRFIILPIWCCAW